MKRGVFGRCGLLLAVVLLSGCRTDEDRCQDLCRYFDECTTLDAICNDYEIEDCAEDVDDFTDSCQEAFDDLTDCLRENEDEDCYVTRERCKSEVDALFGQCDGLM
jgi:hypothetical protein